MRKTTLALAIAALMAFAIPAGAQEGSGNISVIHGVPGLTVDVFVNGELTIPDFEPGDVAGPLELPAGDYDLAVSPAGAGLDAAVLTGAATVTDGLNASIVANLDADGNPALNIFVNDTSTVAAGEARLIVRHTAAAPAVDILLADGTPLFEGVENPQEGQVDVPAGSYDVEIAPAGAGVDASVFSAPGVELAEGTARIVYATGDLAGGSFGLVIQDITGLHSTPDTVNTGGGELAGSGAQMWLVVAFAIAALGAVVTAPKALRRGK